MKPTVIGLTSWPNTREGVLTKRREPAPTTFAAPANILRREMESNIVISLKKTAGAHGVITFDRTRQAASMVQIGVVAVACVGPFQSQGEQALLTSSTPCACCAASTPVRAA